jgi:hypothetical protein
MFWSVATENLVMISLLAAEGPVILCHVNMTEDLVVFWSLVVPGHVLTTV